MNTATFSQDSDSRAILTWLALPLGMMLFISLWLTYNPAWHLFVWLLAIFLSVWRKVSWRLVVGRILPLLVFLLILQMVLSSYSREILLQLFKGQASWDQWKYPLFAVERLALPLIMVLAFERDLTKPTTIAAMGAFFQPLKWLGIPVHKFQLMLTVSIRFIPVLKGEWERFQAASHSFRSMGGQGESGLVARIRENLVVFRAMVSHVIRRAALTGDMLALRGTTLYPQRLPQEAFLRLMGFWVLLFITVIMWLEALLPIWVFFTVWFSLMQVSLQKWALR